MTCLPFPYHTGEGCTHGRDSRARSRFTPQSAASVGLFAGSERRLRRPSQIAPRAQDAHPLSVGHRGPLPTRKLCRPPRAAPRAEVAPPPQIAPQAAPPPLATVARSPSAGCAVHRGLLLVRRSRHLRGLLPMRRPHLLRWSPRPAPRVQTAPSTAGRSSCGGRAASAGRSPRAGRATFPGCGGLLPTRRLRRLRRLPRATPHASLC